MEESCELAIIGNGYAGICALNAASRYLKHGDKVIVVDQGMAWGGQWVNQYGYNFYFLYVYTLSSNSLVRRVR